MERARHYRLDGHTPVPCTMEEWAASFGPADQRTVARTDIDGVTISTVFLGLNHAYDWRHDDPAIFETMVFADDETMDQDCTRYATWADAEAGHAVVVAQVRTYLAGELEPS